MYRDAKYASDELTVEVWKVSIGQQFREATRNAEIQAIFSWKETDRDR